MQATSTTPIPQPLQFQGTTGIPNLMSMSSGSGLHIPSMPQTHLPQLAAETQQVIWTMMSMVHHLGRQGADMIDINGTLKSIAEQQRRLHEDQKSFRDDQNSFREEQNSFREEQNSFREELKSFREEQHGFQDILVHNTVREREEQRSTNSAVLRRPFERSPPSNLPFASQERRSTQQPSPQEERCRR
ncbi:hypothetical protein BGZ58_001665 [Dissophora ornata]|nr:hypothetical protein BGZ58_001665 [Dissophora ornata]